MSTPAKRPVFLGDVYLPAYNDEQKRAKMLTSPLVEHRGIPPVPVACWRWHELMSLLLVAQTGAGKTTLLRVVIDQLCKDPVPKVLMLNDGKEVGSFYLFENRPADSLVRVKFCNDKDDLVQVIGGVAVEVAARKKRLARARKESVARQGRIPGWEPFVETFVVIDDYIGWLLLLDDPEVVKQVLGWLSVIAFQGREVKIHLILAMQTAHSKILDVGLSPQLKLNMDAKVVVPGDKGLAAVQAGMLFDDRSASERIPGIKGGGLYRVGTAEVQLMVPNFPDPSDPESDLTDEEVERLFQLIAA